MSRSRKRSATFEAARARVQVEAAQTRAAPVLMAKPSTETPALHGLLTAVREAIEGRLPIRITHAGTAYRLRLSALVRVEVLDGVHDASDEILFTGGLIATTPEPGK